MRQGEDHLLCPSGGSQLRPVRLDKLRTRLGSNDELRTVFISADDAEKIIGRCLGTYCTFCVT